MTGAVQSWLSEAVPSEQRALLEQTLGQRVAALDRYFMDEDDSASPAPSVVVNDGPLLLTLEGGLVLGFGHQPSQNSLTVWLESGPDVPPRDEPIAADPDFEHVSLADAPFGDLNAQALLGQTVAGWTAYRGAPDRAVYAGLPNERALVLHLNSGARLVIGYGLYDDSEAFTVSGAEAARPALVGLTEQALA